MADREPPSVVERQHVDRLVAAVLSGLSPGQALGAGITDRLAIVTSVMLSEAAEQLYHEPEGIDVNLDTPAYRRYAALDELLGAMAERKAARPHGKRPLPPG
jgi:hypothetical protein